MEDLRLNVRTAVHDWVQWRSLYVKDPEGNEVELVCFDPAIDKPIVRLLLYPQKTPAVNFCWGSLSAARSDSGFSAVNHRHDLTDPAPLTCQIAFPDN